MFGSDGIACWTDELREGLFCNNIIIGIHPKIFLVDWEVSDPMIKIIDNCLFSTIPWARDDYITTLKNTVQVDSLHGNVFKDPMLVDPRNGDLRLQKGSPCIDAGAPWILDVDGTRSDIGAFGGPDGQFYIYQDLPPQQPQKFCAWRDDGRVIVQWEKNTESDFRFYILFRSGQSAFSLDSANVLAYLTLDAKPIGNDRPIKHLHSVGFVDTLPSKELYTGYIPIYSDSIFNQVTFTNDGVSPNKDYYYVLVAVDSSLLSSEPTPTVGVLGSGLSVETEIPRVEHSEPVLNYPNPFNATTAIVYNLPDIGAQPAPIRLTIFNSLGQQVRTLVDDRQMPGRHIIYWNSDDDFGHQVASGIYFYRLEVSGIEFVKSGKMILMK